MSVGEVIWRGECRGTTTKKKQASKQTNKQENKKQTNENFENLWTQEPIIDLSLSFDTVKPCHNFACYQGFEKKSLLGLYVLVLVKTGVTK